jgi:hypothetical protein
MQLVAAVLQLNASWVSAEPESFADLVVRRGRDNVLTYDDGISCIQLTRPSELTRAARSLTRENRNLVIRPSESGMHNRRFGTVTRAADMARYRSHNRQVEGLGSLAEIRMCQVTRHWSSVPQLAALTRPSRELASHAAPAEYPHAMESSPVKNKHTASTLHCRQIEQFLA